ncbi:MAG TPA: Ig-like domain-containing protein, partial [Longimicrobium sp.]|nr:Ig-like domain-containing protein [Longimicrobium sp.]
MIPNLRLRAAVPALVLVLSAACGETPGATETVEQGAATFVIVSGDGQTGAAGEELPQPLVVRAVDASGNPVPGRHVGFHVVDGDGEMYVGGGVSDATGIVKDYWTLGRVALDSQRVEARSVDPVTGAKQVFGVFRASAVPGAPAMAVRQSSSDFSGPARSLVRDTLWVEVRDRFNNPIRQAGIAVKWIPSGNGNINVSSRTTYTDAQGVAWAMWRFSGTAGLQTLSTSVGGAPAIVTFTGTASAAAAVSVSVLEDSVLVTSVGVLIPLTISATDVYGNPVPLTYQSLNNAVVSGTPRSVGNGVTRLVVKSGTKADTVVVTVRQVATSVSFTTAFPTTRRVGYPINVASFTAVRDSMNSPMSVTNAWTSSNPTVASVDAAGMLTPHAPGTLTVTATVEGLTAVSPTITITP